MSERNGPRKMLFGLLLTTSLGVFAAQSALAEEAASDAAPARPALESLKELDGKAPARRSLDIQTWQTAEGAKVLFVEAHELPMFDMRLTFAAGSSQDQNLPGVAVLTNAMLNEGVKGKDVTAIAQGFEGLGADFSNGAYRDMAVASIRSLSATDKREPALKLFSEVVGKPTFPADSLTRIKNQLLASFEYKKQNPGSLAGEELFKRLYGNHPYGHPSEGTAESIKPITLAQLKAFHAKAYAAGNAVIALVGDLSRDEAQAIAAQVSASLPKGPALAKLPTPAEPKAGETHIEFPSKQTHLMLAQLGITRNDPDYAALSLGNSVLGGGGFGSRLMTEVREKRGLTYGVSSGFTPMQTQGPFMIGLQTRAELSENTLKLVQDIVRDFLANGPTQKELDDAKRELTGSFPLTAASNSSIVAQLGAIGFYDLPLTFLEDFITQSQSVTVEQVKEVMNKHLSADKMVIVTAGPTVAQKPLPPPTDKPAERPLGVPEH
ncbi:M16 family metallopeptidase [Pseudomonas syringae group sp. J309-1]|uniref:M16 family metallopeptidase n=1 Tax=Pseudomonas syringae group sp. J309-1 TaxID=3079588 RepID=UPI000420DD55|nr:pitrilysin family protein [Pseudomonas syringae group sp. J309-1]MCQ3032820.1 insulinase family protein [Pseudomonas syringae]MDG6400955.1 pitrilysin family protein [Pseudomonas quasicaspiana]MDU8358626.1 pitrilysin family protein [Pseudomonas syringae group sp. J309-1]